MIDTGPYIQTLNGKPVAVFGLGVSGMATVKALVSGGAHVLAWDDNQERRNEAQALGAEMQCLNQEALQHCASLVLAPGVPLTHPEPHDIVKAAQAAGIEILSDIEILGRLHHGRKTIGITGTNGKSTTTALIAHMLDECGVPNAMGGNIGTAALALEMPPENGVFVLEISSYQLDLCPNFTPDIAVLLNITPDHIDRHGTFENYTASKMKIFRDADQVQIKFPEIDDRVRGCGNMKGDHNLQNATAALLVGEALGLNAPEIVAAIKTFPGLKHRQYLVREIGGVQYVNDSKATNAQAAAKALGAYENIFWIAGGQAKEGGLQGLEALMPRVQKTFLIGEAAPAFSTWLSAHKVYHEQNHILADALKAAHQAAQAQGQAVVLLSPACASWDQFQSFEDRGDQFTDMVRAL